MLPMVKIDPPDGIVATSGSRRRRGAATHDPDHATGHQRSSGLVATVAGHDSADHMFVPQSTVMKPGCGSRRVATNALAVSAGCAAATMTVVAVAIEHRSPTTSYATAPVAYGAGMVAGIGLLGAGAAAFAASPQRRWATPLGALAVCWMSPYLVAWEDGPPLVRSVAMIVAAFTVPLVVYLAVAFADGFAGPLGAVAVGVATTVTVVLGIIRALVRDPFLDLHCWDNCTVNSFLMSARPALARDLDELWLRFAVVTGLVVLVHALVRSRSARAHLRPALIALAGVGSAETVRAAVLIAEPHEDPRHLGFQLLFLGRSGAFALLAVTLGWAVTSDLRTQRALARLAQDLAAVSGESNLRRTLQRVLDDEQVGVSFWVPSLDRFVDDRGHPATVDHEREDARRVTITRGGRTVALVTYSGNHRAPALERAIGSAARLALDNERLRAELQAQVIELQASRARVVEAADDARRRIERDLHDGAQQRLITLSFELRLALAEARTTGRDDIAALLEAASTQARAALEGLRALAHGIFPSILVQAGLEPALAALAVDAPLPVDVTGTAGPRFAATAEMAAYVAVADAVRAASGSRASMVEVRLDRRADALHVAVCHDGDMATDIQDRLVTAGDRVSAVGGAMTVVSGQVEATVPCVPL